MRLRIIPRRIREKATAPIRAISSTAVLALVLAITALLIAIGGKLAHAR